MASAIEPLRFAVERFQADVLKLRKSKLVAQVFEKQEQRARLKKTR